MAIEVLSPAKKYNATCPHCEARLAFIKTDVEPIEAQFGEIVDYRIKCPECKKDFSVKSVVEYDRRY